MLNEKEQEIVKDKANYFFKNQDIVHIKFKKGHWKRGYIREMSSDFFILDELLEGEMPVFFLEIIGIEKYNKKEVGDYEQIR